MDQGGLGELEGTSTKGSTQSRAKTALRMGYEAEVALIKKKIGSIDDVRGKLGLSKRKMCQLLLVDPSAWTRWGKTPQQIPPHIYRSLQWYLALTDQKPEWHPKNTYLGAFGETQSQMRKTEMDKVLDENQILREKLTTLMEAQKKWKLWLGANTLLLLSFLLAFFFVL